MREVHITDVTLREYGQNVPGDYLHIFGPGIRSWIAESLIRAGFTSIEILSCVHPAIAPAMGGDLIARIASSLGRIQGVHLITLVPNRAGYRNFLSLGLGPDGFNHSMGIFLSAVEAHNLANLRRSISETIEEYKSILSDARKRGIRILGYVSAAFGYREPEKGRILKASPEQVNDLVDRLFDLGVEAVTLSDLQGVAGGKETLDLLEGILEIRKGRDIQRLGYHPHHVSGKSAVANSLAVCRLGIRRFDASIGGTGGCITGAPGNQPTELLVRSFHRAGINTGLDEKRLFLLAGAIQERLYSKIKLKSAEQGREKGSRNAGIKEYEY